jgi:superfamily I DNA and RNA helicase
MKVENIGARLYTLPDGTKLIPGAPAIEVDDAQEVNIKGIKELKVTHTPKAQEVEFKEVPTTKAELAAALTEKGVKFDQSQSKAELQALYDEAK